MNFKRGIEFCKTDLDKVKYFFNQLASFENWARFHANKSTQDIENLTEEEATKLLQQYLTRDSI